MLKLLYSMSSLLNNLSWTLLVSTTFQSWKSDKMYYVHFSTVLQAQLINKINEITYKTSELFNCPISGIFQIQQKSNTLFWTFLSNEKQQKYWFYKSNEKLIVALNTQWGHAITNWKKTWQREKGGVRERYSNF
jgi:hypothetical protein